MLVGPCTLFHCANKETATYPYPLSFKWVLDVLICNWVGTYLGKTHPLEPLRKLIFPSLGMKVCQYFEVKVTHPLPSLPIRSLHIRTSALRMARPTPTPGPALQGSTRPEPVLAPRLYGLQMGNGIFVYALYYRRSPLGCFPRSGAKPVLSQGAFASLFGSD